MRTLRRTLAAVLVMAACLAPVALSAETGNRLDALPNPFFAMDTGTKDENHATPAAQAGMLKELGYAGIGYSGFDGIGEMLAALDAAGLRMFTVYFGVNVEPDGCTYDAKLEEACAALKGRDVILWITMMSKTYAPSSIDGDAQAVESLRSIADTTAAAGLRVALYPHTGCWLEVAADAVRLAEKVGRENLGATFNLCHWLNAEKGKHMQAVLAGALPHLFVATINGADTEGGWDRLIQTLDRGAFDVRRLVDTLFSLGYTGPIGLQGYGIGGDVHDNLKRSMAAWQAMSRSVANAWIDVFDGKDLDAWREATGDWVLADRVFKDPNDEKRLAWETGTGIAVNGEKGRTRHLITKIEHGDIQAHIEFMVPKGSNSGVYFQGRYEIQVLDSWGVEHPTYNDCGGIYQRWHEEKGVPDDQRGYEGRPPRVNAARRPGEWQSFDATFRAPRFDQNGAKIADAEFVEVRHNGVLVHENQVLSGPTRATLFNDEKAGGPMMFQGDHGPVAYRNIRIRPLEPSPYEQILSYDFGQSRAALVAIEKEIFETDPADFGGIEAKLLAVLESPQATFACRQSACRMLRRVGTEHALPALAALLEDEKLSHMARYVLEAAPWAGVDDALLAALENTAGKTKVGIINSLGERRSEAANEALAKLVHAEDLMVAEAAIAALGKIGGPQAVMALSELRTGGNAALRPAASRAYLACANRLLEAGEREKAAALFEELRGTGEAPAIQVAAFRGLVAAQPDDVAKILSTSYEDDDPLLRPVILRLMRDVPGEEATRMFAGLLAAASSEQKALLLIALADRADPAAEGAVLAAMDDEDEAVRIAALDALGAVGSASCAVRLTEAAASSKGRERDAARGSLARLRGGGVNGVLCASLDGAGPEVKAEVARALAARHAVETVPALLALAKDAEAPVRSEAYRALGDLAGEADLPSLVGLLVAEESKEDRSAAEKALLTAAQRVPDETKRSAAVVAALPKAKDAGVRCSLLGVLGKLAGPAALEALRAAWQDDTPEIQDAVVRALAAWPAADPLADLERIAQQGGSETHRVLALQGFIRLVGLPSERPASETLGLYGRAMDLATRPDEKKQVLGGVANIATPEALEMAKAYLTDKELTGEAAVAALKIAEALCDAHPRDVGAAMEQIIAAAGDDALTSQAQALMNKARIKLLAGRNFASEGTASSPDGLEKDGGAGGDAAAIDGNTETYWDEEDGKDLYRYQVAFQEPHDVIAISILGHEHHKYAPKDFEILCNGAVIHSVEGAEYADNFFFVEFPKQRCTTLELKITGCHGASPAIRELGIYGPKEEAPK